MKPLFLLIFPCLILAQKPYIKLVSKLDHCSSFNEKNKGRYRKNLYGSHSLSDCAKACLDIKDCGEITIDPVEGPKGWGCVM